MGKRDVIHKTGSALSSEEDRATATDNVYGKFCEDLTRVSEIWTQRQT